MLVCHVSNEETTLGQMLVCHVSHECYFVMLTMLVVILGFVTGHVGHCFVAMG